MRRVWWWIVCNGFGHREPDDWTPDQGRWVRCIHCGTRFNAYAERKADEEMRTW